VVAGSIAARIVAARSGADTPVATDLASIDTHIGVPRREELSVTTSGISSASSRSGVIDRQSRPRAWVIMKLTASGVTRSAAMVRSPSFSRSSSSTTTIIPPARIAASPSSIVENGVLRRTGRSVAFAAGTLAGFAAADAALPDFGLDTRFDDRTLVRVIGSGAGGRGVRAWPAAPRIFPQGRTRG
jgi:hypothetical protein